MNGNELMNWLLSTALNGLFQMHPSLVGSLVGSLNINSPTILRIENFPVYIQITGGGADSIPGTPVAPSSFPSVPRLTLEDPRDGTVIATSEEAGAARSGTKLGEQRQVRLDLAPVRYRLYPHLVFDERGSGQGETELEIAPWVKVIVFGDVEYVDFTTLGPRRSKQRIHLDRENRTRLRGVGLNDMVPFGRNRQASPKGDNIKWSFKRFPLGTATPVGSANGEASTNPILVTADRAVYDAAWRLTGTDRRLGVFPQHFLLLRERREGDEHV